MLVDYRYPYHQAVPQRVQMPHGHPSFPHMSCIIDPVQGVGGLYLGNWESCQDLQTLRNHGIEAVISLLDSNLPNYDSTDVRWHKKIQIYDCSDEDLRSYFKEINKFINKHSENTNILVHCYAGVSRSATAVIAYLMYSYNLTTDQALSYCRSRRRLTNPNPGFLQQLYVYEDKLYGHLKIEPPPQQVRAQSANRVRSHQIFDHVPQKAYPIAGYTYATHQIQPQIATTSGATIGHRVLSSSGFFNQNLNQSRVFLGASRQLPQRAFYHQPSQYQFFK